MHQLTKPSSPWAAFIADNNFDSTSFYLLPETRNKKFLRATAGIENVRIRPLRGSRDV